MYLPVRRNARGYYPTVNNAWRMFDRMVEDFATDETRSITTDIVENEQEYLITSELPGLEKKDVRISIDKNQLVIEAEIREETEEKDKNWIRRERYQGSYKRSFILNDSCDREQIKAEMDKGVLNVHIPKAAPLVSKQIEIK
ncbi:MAG: Hsp20 family protein [Candidatus Stygibacter frigidus]|nr:Hsp20 family protein [Candidatus Stygibacter frigidus]